MPLTPETGAIVAGANTYVTLAEQKAFIGSIPQPTATDAELERAIVLAARYLDGNYRARWKGVKESITQSMEWPRYVVAGVLPGTIPQRLKDAQCELALRALSGELSADTTTGIKREKVDVLETEYFSGQSGKAAYPVVDQLLSDYLKPLGSSDLVRG